MTEKTQQELLRDLVSNALPSGLSTRSQMLQTMLDPRRDLDTECGYPTDISIDQYNRMYEREGLATRSVAIFPEETWVDDPVLSDQPDDVHNEETSPFEKEYQALTEKIRLYSYLQRIDILSGIGQYGLLFYGFSDGKDFKEPVVPSTDLKLLYLRAFSQTQVSIASYENDQTNERYGQPLTYNVCFGNNDLSASSDGATQPTNQTTVHYTRILHVADNRDASEVFGVPRMRMIYNRLYDLRKILGGSGEMFWKGAFPGYAFEVDPNAGSDFEGGVELDKDSLRDEFERYSNGLQRYLALEGVTAKSLSPQVADPSKHVETETKVVAMCLGVPHRIFVGSEEAKLASSEDTKRWNKRIKKRRDTYITPWVLRPLVDHLMALGILPQAEYAITWPRLDEETPKQKAETFEIKARAMTQLVGSMLAGAPMTKKDFYYLAKEHGLTKETFAAVLAEMDENGELV